MDFLKFPYVFLVMPVCFHKGTVNIPFQKMVQMKGSIWMLKVLCGLIHTFKCVDTQRTN